MQIKTNKGIGEPMPLTDIQEYNQRLEENTAETRRTRKGLYVVAIVMGIIGLMIISYVIWLTWYVIHNQVLTNILKIMAGTFGC